MELTNQYRNGILKLAALLGLLCFFVVLSNWYPKSEPSLVLDEESQCFIDNQKLILADNDKEKRYIYYVNSITDYTGYQLGLSIQEIDHLLAYQKTGKKIYSLKEFKSISKIDAVKLENIKHKLVFPKQNKVFKKKIKGAIKGNTIDASLNKWDINLTTSAHLHNKCNLPWKISNRIVNYRNSIKKYTSMEQLNKVYGISKSDLKCLRTHYQVLNR